jgi:hypothetical protein
LTYPFRVRADRRRREAALQQLGQELSRAQGDLRSFHVALGMKARQEAADTAVVQSVVGQLAGSDSASAARRANHQTLVDQLNALGGRLAQLDQVMRAAQGACAPLYMARQQLEMMPPSPDTAMRRAQIAGQIQQHEQQIAACNQERNALLPQLAALQAQASASQAQLSATDLNAEGMLASLGEKVAADPALRERFRGEVSLIDGARNKITEIETAIAEYRSDLAAYGKVRALSGRAVLDAFCLWRASADTVGVGSIIAVIGLLLTAFLTTWLFHARMEHTANNMRAAAGVVQHFRAQESGQKLMLADTLWLTVDPRKYCPQPTVVSPDEVAKLERFKGSCRNRSDDYYGTSECRKASRSAVVDPGGDQLDRVRVCGADNHQVAMILQIPTVMVFGFVAAFLVSLLGLAVRGIDPAAPARVKREAGVVLVIGVPVAVLVGLGASALAGSYNVGLMDQAAWPYSMIVFLCVRAGLYGLAGLLMIVAALRLLIGAGRGPRPAASRRPARAGITAIVAAAVFLCGCGIGLANLTFGRFNYGEEAVRALRGGDASSRACSHIVRIVDIADVGRAVVRGEAMTEDDRAKSSRKLAAALGRIKRGEESPPDRVREAVEAVDARLARCAGSR